MNKEGDTPVFIAADQGDFSIVKTLCENDADTGLGEKDGHSILKTACEKGNKEAVELLLGNGAKPNVSDEGGETSVSLGMWPY